MADKKMYFGTEQFMTWIPCPAINATANTVRWRTANTFLNGGASVRQSNAGHKEYSFSWNPQRKDDIYAFLSFFDGTYGDGPFYFLDPVAMDANVLPSWFAAPFVAAQDGPSWIVGDQAGNIRPEMLATGVNALGYPTRSAQYSLNAGQAYAPVKVAVPEGYELHFGVHGTSSGTAGVRAIPSNNPTSPVNINMLNTTTTIRTNAVLPGGTVYSFVPRGTGTMTIAGMIAQVLPVGSSVPLGGFIPGQGSSGVRLSGDPQVTEYSAALTNASVGASVTLIETGAWE